jgi:hypothetical protein
MTRPIEQQRELWISVKEAAALRGRHVQTVYTWMRTGTVRTWYEPGGRVLVYLPDCVPPSELPPRNMRTRNRER